ncbi:MAG: helix-turn-helix domain-containing protein [bacterium]
MEKYITVTELADLLRSSTPTIYRKIREKQIPYKKFGKRYLFSIEEIGKFININIKKTKQL